VGCQNLRLPRWKSVCAPPQLFTKNRNNSSAVQQ
jgi:hypothetical protein